MDVSFCMFMSVDIINKYSHTNSTLQGCSKWVSRGIRDRYFFVGIIDRAAWDIARDNDQAAGPVIRIANSRSNRASTASIIYSNGTVVRLFTLIGMFNERYELMI